MAITRSSPRNAEKNTSSPKSAAGTKRKADETTSPSAKQPAKQKKIEDLLPSTDKNDEAKDAAPGADEEVKDAQAEANGQSKDEEVKDVDAEADKEVKDAEANAIGEAKEEVSENKDEARTEDKSEGTNGKAENATIEATAIEEDKQREKAQPSNILEKGIIYFFTRGRVGVDDPNSVQDLQRSFFVLRPLPAGAKITDGAIQDVGNNRLLALPKKVWPKSGKDRFMVFVEKAGVTMDTLKEEFFSGSEYSTKTTGVRQTPDVTPIGEGVYAITSTGSGRPTTHLAYMLTIPSKLGEVQSDVGIKNKGSFVLSLKNPESSGPANAQLPEKPDWPKEFIHEFSGRGWMPVAPKHIDYANAQMLLIGEDFESSGNLEPTPQDEKKDEKETPQEELEKLEEEDEHRVEHLKGDDTVFADLGISSQDYPKVMTTW